MMSNLAFPLPSCLRSQLFVPGNRPERFDKAVASGADLVCIDLEDAVGPNDKSVARQNALTWLANTEARNVGLRINAFDTDHAKEDLMTLYDSGLSLPFLMIPKVDSRAMIDHLAKDLPERLGTFFPLIESAKGLLAASEIFAAPRVSLALFGSVDFSASMACDHAWEAHLYARGHLVTCAAAHDVTLFDAPHIIVGDLEDCEASTRRANALGIHARSAIHPAQVARIHAALAPSDAEIIEARAIIAASDAADGNVVLLDGKFIEEPVIKSARKLLSRL